LKNKEDTGHNPKPNFLKMNPTSTHLNLLRDPLDQLYCSKCCAIASGNTSLIQPCLYMEEWFIQARP